MLVNYHRHLGAGGHTGKGAGPQVGSGPPSKMRASLENAALAVNTTSPNKKALANLFILDLLLYCQKTFQVLNIYIPGINKGAGSLRFPNTETIFSRSGKQSVCHYARNDRDSMTAS
jgi:hypothetical protein